MKLSITDIAPRCCVSCWLPH